MSDAASPPDQLPPGERQLRIKNLRVDHGRFREGIDALRKFHYPVEGGYPDFGAVKILAGDSRTGKTYVAKSYQKDFPESVGEEGMVFPVLYADMPIEGTTRGLLESIADPLGIKYSLKMNGPSLLAAILKGLVDRKVELLLLDEFQEIFNPTKKPLLDYGRKLVRKILNLGTLNVVCIGLMETYTYMAKDPQLTGRGGLPYQILHPYEWDTRQEQALFRYLCDEIDRALPFAQKSGLRDQVLAQRLYEATRGNIGRLKDFIYAAGCLAINDGASHIEVAHFAAAHDKRKPPGTTFNPFVHDPSMAPRPPALKADRRGELTPAQLLTKRSVA